MSDDQVVVVIPEETVVNVTIDGEQGPPGPPGPGGSGVGGNSNIDGGSATENFGGTFGIDGGEA